MTAVDTSSLIAFFRGDQGEDVDWMDQALEWKHLALPPVVVAEVLSSPGLSMTSPNWCVNCLFLRFGQASGSEQQ